MSKLLTNEDVAYIARCKCGGIVYAAVDLPEYRKDTGKDVADLIAKGFTVEHVPIATAREGVWCSSSKTHMSALDGVAKP